MAVATEKIQFETVNFGLSTADDQSLKILEDNTKFSYDTIDMVFKRRRANNQIERWIDKIKQFPERKSVYIKFIKKLIAFEINIISKDDKNRIE